MAVDLFEGLSESTEIHLECANLGREAGPMASMSLSMKSYGGRRVVKRRKVRYLEHATASPSREGAPDANGDATLSGLERLSDDALGEVFGWLAHLDPCTPLKAAVQTTLQQVGSLVCTSQRFATLYQQGLKNLRAEMKARASTQITPRSLECAYPFARQLESETASHQQLRVMRKGMSGVAIHCAGPCCARQRNLLNRELKAQAVVPIAEKSSMVAPNLAGTVCFVAGRRRTKRDHDLARAVSPHHEEFLMCKSLQTFSTTAMLIFDDMEEFSAPQHMCSNQEGTRVALVRAIKDVSQDVPHSAVFAWNVLDAATLQRIAPPGELDDHGIVNAQSAWYVQTDSSELLAVLWSTGYVHPSGAILGSNAHLPSYGIALYADNELDTFVGPFWGKAQMAHPRQDGVEVAVRIRTSSNPVQPPFIQTTVHNVFSEKMVSVDHSMIASKLVHPADRVRCPAAVALSPQGDCLVAVHRPYDSVILEVLVKSEQGPFVSDQTVDVTAWTSLGTTEANPFDLFSNMWEGRSPFLKFPYSVQFSPCGRYAAIVDRRPQFGMAITNHSVVVLDLAMRKKKRHIRSLPLGSVEDIAPRSIEWTEAGIVFQARQGCLLLRA